MSSLFSETFGYHVQLVLHPTAHLPAHLDLGKYSCSWLNGTYKHEYKEQIGSRRLAPAEFTQLMRKLQTSPHVLVLNLNWNCDLSGGRMVEFAGCIATLKSLQVLDLACIHPPHISLPVLFDDI